MATSSTAKTDVIKYMIANFDKYRKRDVLPKINIYAKTISEKENAYHIISFENNGIGFEQKSNPSKNQYL